MNQDARVAFKVGQVYEFSMNAHGEVSTLTSNGVHMFRASGPESWTVYFKYELEDVVS